MTPSGREGDQEVVEGARGDKRQNIAIMTHALFNYPLL